MNEDDKCRTLGRLLNHTEELLHVAPAVHRAADGQRSWPVWLGVGKIRERPEYAVFIFSRAIFACLEGLQEWLYCVLPVVANIDLDLGASRCGFSWSRPPGPWHGRSPIGPCDCTIEDVRQGSEVLLLLEDSHHDACSRGLVFHEEQRTNHRELWRYQHAIPTDLAGLPSSSVSISGTRRTKCSIRDSFETSSRIKLLCITWNVGASLPQDGATLQQLLEEEELADLVCIGLQETCELSARRLIADGDEWFAWREWAEREVGDFYGDELELLAYSHLVGMLILVFARSMLRDQISNIRTAAIGLGVGGYGGNKGAVSVRFDLGSASVCFVNAHLASGQEHYIERCQHFNTIMKRIEFQEGDEGDFEELVMEHAITSPTVRSPSAPACAEAARPATATFVDRRAAARETYHIEDHDHIFWVGDTNSRLHWPGKLGGMPIQDARHKVQERRLGELLALDQLNLSRRDGLAFQGFEEHGICFLPSYKWCRHGDALDMRSQKHVPAWTDRILYRSTARPGALVHRYDMHPGLRQSDHRPVFACCTVPCHGLQESGAREERGLHALQACADAGLSMEPAELTFRALKPDHPQESSVRLTVHGPRIVRFKVLLKWPDGQLHPIGSPSLQRGSEEARSGAGASGEPAPAPLLARWLVATPAQGALHRGRPTELRVSLCLGEAALRRQEVDATVVIRLQDSPLHTYELPVRAMLVPSVLRAPLGALAAVGSRPLLQSEAAEEAERPSAASGAAAACLPPKEALTVMQWVLQQSRDTLPGMLEWWPDPLIDGVCRGKDELSEVQRYVEHGWPLPVGRPQMPPRSAALFLLRWLQLLPEPVLPHTAAELFDGSEGALEGLPRLPPLPRSVLLCTAALFAQLAARHGPRGDITTRLAACLMQQPQPSKAARQLLGALMAELLADPGFPPSAALAALASKDES